MKLSANFNLSELTKSQTAERKGIPNNPSPSQHAEGKAADLEIPSIDNKELAWWIRNNLEVDQLILEFYKEGEPNSGWIHVSYNEESNRNQYLIASRNEDGKTMYKPW